MSSELPRIPGNAEGGLHPLPVDHLAPTNRTDPDHELLHRANAALRQRQVNDRLLRVAFEAALKPVRQLPLWPATHVETGTTTRPTPKSHVESAPFPPLKLQQTPSRPAQRPTSPLPQSRPHEVHEDVTRAATQLMEARLPKPGQLKVLRADRLRRNLTVYRVLLDATYRLIAERGQAATHITSYTWFTVLDLLPIATGFSVATCERATADLRTCGLIATRSDWTTTTFLTAEGTATETRAKTGVWLCVLLQPRPDEPERRAYIRRHEVPEGPRDLNADRKSGRTAWQARKDAQQEVRESSPCKNREVGITSLLQWALKIETQKKSVKRDSLTLQLQAAGTPKDLVWSLRALMSEHPQRRAETIQAAAEALTTLFRDQQSTKHYYRILWRATTAEFEGRAAFAALESAMCRTVDAMRETQLRNPGGYLTKLLRESGWLDAVYHRPGHTALMA